MRVLYVTWCPTLNLLSQDKEKKQHGAQVIFLNTEKEQGVNINLTCELFFFFCKLLLLLLLSFLLLFSLFGMYQISLAASYSLQIMPEGSK